MLVNTAAMRRVMAAAAVAQHGSRDALAVSVSASLAVTVTGNRMALQAEHRFHQSQHLAIRRSMGVVAR